MFANTVIVPAVVPRGVSSLRSLNRQLKKPFQLPRSYLRAQWEAGMADFQRSPAHRLSPGAEVCRGPLSAQLTPLLAGSLGSNLSEITLRCH